MQITAVRTLTTKLAAPGLSSSVAASTATLTWTAPTPTGQSVIAGYRVYKASSVSGPFTQIGAALPASQLSLADTLPGTQFYKVEAFDQFLTGVSSTPVQCVPSAGRFKFNASPVYWQLDYNQSKSAQFSRMAALKALVPETMGFEFMPFWGDLENPALVGGAAQYDGSWAVGDQTIISNQKGFKLLDSFLAEAARLGCQLSIQVRAIGGGVTPGTQTSFPSTSMPAYLNSTTYGPVNSSTGEFGGAWINNQSTNTVRFAWYIRWWDQRTMNRINAYGQVMGARYDSNLNLECVGFLADETVVDAQTGCTDAQQIATLTGASGYMAIWRSSFPHTMCRNWFNYFQSTAPTMDTMLAEAFNRNWSVGGPDTANESPVSSADPTLNSDGIYRSVASDYRWLGYTAATGDGGVRDNTKPDYKSLGGHRWCEVEAEDTSYDTVTNTTVANSRHIGDGILQHIVNQANRLGATHMVWFDNTFSGRTQVRTNSAHPNLCDFLRSLAQGGNVAINGVTSGISLTNTAYPSSFPQ